MKETAIEGGNSGVKQYKANSDQRKLLRGKNKLNFFISSLHSRKKGQIIFLITFILKNELFDHQLKFKLSIETNNNNSTS